MNLCSCILNLKAGIGKTTIDKLIAIAESGQQQLFDILKNINENTEFSARARNIMLEILNYIYKYQYLKEEMSLSELAGGVIDEMGILDP